MTHQKTFIPFEECKGFIMATNHSCDLTSARLYDKVDKGKTCHNLSQSSILYISGDY
jgi:hypothetical protein